MTLPTPSPKRRSVARDRFEHVAFRLGDGVLAAFWIGRVPEMAVAYLVGVLGALLAAWALTRSACQGFDAHLDRPNVAAPTAGDEGRGGVPSRPRARFRSVDPQVPLKLNHPARSGAVEHCAQKRV